MDMKLAGDYYGEYYDKSYKDYYDLKVDNENLNPAKPKPAVANSRS